MSAPPTVLVVDDNRSIRPLLRRVLEARGYRVIEAWTGHEAMGLVEADGGPLDLLVTDVRMPGLSGTELGERLAVRFPEMRILFVSGESDASAEHFTASDHRRAFLLKPFTADVFLSAVSALLDA